MELVHELVLKRRWILNNNIRLIIVALCLSSILTACISNEPFHPIAKIQDCAQPSDCECANKDKACGISLVERHENYDLAFIEFTERGNFFSRSNSRYVYDFIISDRIKTLAGRKDGVAVVVFVHGWKHNAKATDTNVLDFKIMLERFAQNEVFGSRRIVGLYLGWRGLSVNLPGLKQLTFWDRKTVAEEVGSGGVTDVLSRLNLMLVTPQAEREEMMRSGMPGAIELADKNSLLIIGHSFGGAIVMSALHDVYLNNILAAQRNRTSIDDLSVCEKVEKFADGVVLLNPALEANRGFQLKEAALECDFAKQPKLMHIISSDGDSATKYYFPIGQYLKTTLTWNQELLKQKVRGKDIEIHERDLDTITVGNLQHFRSGYLTQNKDKKSWSYARCDEETPEALDKCGITNKKALKNHLPYLANSPLSFIKTDDNFIENHNDVFNCKVQSYLTAIMLETQSVDHGFVTANFDQPRSKSAPYRSQTVKNCGLESFDFRSCFNNQLKVYCPNEATER